MNNKDKVIAYFCAEYALSPDLPIYEGGLGVLAGDYIREAADEKIPMVGIGLFYNFNNTIKLDLANDAEGVPLQVEIPIQDKKVKAQVFIYKVGPVPVYLLDTNIEENEPSDRLITYKLYTEDKEVRLKQELILGIGGMKVLEKLKINPSIYHLNEGHSAFLSLELIRHEMEERSMGFEEAIGLVRKKIVFTNHTLVAAGLEVFSNDLVSLMLANYAEELKIPVSEVVKLGLVQESSIFSMTMLALRMAGKVNAVSKLHSKKASEIWTNHPIIAITNGIHINTWDKVKDIKNHKIHKEELLKYIQKETNVKWSSNDLLLGWARRFVEYKRPLSILEDIDRFMTIAQNPKYPVKIVFSGEPHENNEDGKEMLQKLENLIKDKIGDSAVYLPHYNMNITEKMVAGCDVWLNTPIVGFEACGTSGMKAALNGVLPCSTRDGWVDEVDLNGIGWILDTDHLSTNILDVLEKDIVPMYYEHQEEWQVRMQNARQMILDKFSTERMLREYMEKLYQPS